MVDHALTTQEWVGALQRYKYLGPVCAHRITKFCVVMKLGERKFFTQSAVSYVAWAGAGSFLERMLMRYLRSTVDFILFFALSVFGYSPQVKPCPQIFNS